MSTDFDKDDSKNEEQYKLYYFNGNGKAMIIRAILYYSKVKFKDIKISKEDWKKLKQTGKFECEEMPVMEHSGKLYYQMHAIEQYLGYNFDIHGKNIEDEYQINCLLDSFDDLFTIFKHFTWPETEEDKEHIDDYQKAFKSKFAFFVSILEKKFTDKGCTDKYYLGNYFSLADIFITVVLTNFADKLSCEYILQEQGPNIYTLIKKIKQNELKNFFENGYIKESKF
jgi:glutathione S-transferase